MSRSHSLNTAVRNISERTKVSEFQVRTVLDAFFADATQALFRGETLDWGQFADLKAKAVILPYFGFSQDPAQEVVFLLIRAGKPLRKALNPGMEDPPGVYGNIWE